MSEYIPDGGDVDVTELTGYEATNDPVSLVIEREIGLCECGGRIVKANAHHGDNAHTTLNFECEDGHDHIIVPGK